MKKKIIIVVSIVLLVAIAIGGAYAIDMNRMKNNKPVVFSTWGKQYVPPVNDYPLGKEEQENSFVGKVIEETTDGMKLIKSDDISTEGFREFELEVELSSEKQKRLALSGDDIQSFVSFGHMSDTNLYYYGLDKVMITIKGFTMPLETALEKGRITLDGIIANCNQDVMDGILKELVYKDGGSQVYKYPDYTIIKYHTLDGNRDVYIGSTDMDINIADK